jgi:ribosome-associated translation inhibitor RaiA
MQINFHQKGLRLSDRQEDYISSKLESLSIFKVMEDPSVVVRVDVEYSEHIASDKKITMAVTATVPQDTLRAETDCLTVEEGVDLLEEKLRAQLEKYKTARS